MGGGSVSVGSKILFRDIRQLLTLRSTCGDAGARRGAQLRDLGLIETAAVLVSGGRITDVGVTDDILKKTKSVGGEIREIDCRNRVVLPGFVDSHTHPVFAAPRLVDFEKRIGGASYEEIAEAGGGIRASIRGVRGSSKEQLAALVLSAFEEMAAHGTTTVEAKSGYGLDLASETKSLEAIQAAAERFPGTVVATLLGAHTVPPELRHDPEA